MKGVQTNVMTTNLAAIAELRAQAKLSISDVAMVLGYKTPTGYWLLEHGERKVSVENLYKLSQLYDVTMEQLLSDQDFIITE